MLKLIINNLEIEATCDSNTFEEFIKPVMAMLKQYQEATWTEISELHDYDIHPEYSLHMTTKYNEEESVGSILIWAANKSPSIFSIYPDLPTVIFTAVAGDKLDVSSAAAELCNKHRDKETFAEFITAHKAAKE